MSSHPSSESTSAGAPAAFLRGVERRALVFATLQCGSRARGDAAVAAALLAFTRIAPTEPMATWPIRFWSTLLAAPDLRRAAADAAWPVEWSTLAGLGNGPRAALLLRLVAGLEMDAAAQALGVTDEQYRAALQRAIPYREDGTPDREAWQAWVADVRAKVSPAARPPEPMPAPRVEPIAPARPSEPARVPARRRWLLIVGAAAVIAGIGAVVVLHPRWVDQLPFRGDLVRTAPLPPADDPIARYDADFAAWTHRDFLAIADPEGLKSADAFPFFAWYAATLATAPAADASRPASPATNVIPASVLAEPPPVFAAPLQIPRDITLPEAASSAIASIPAPMQQGLRDRAALWTTWSPQQRALFAQQAKTWDAQPRAVQTRLRERYAAWRDLDSTAFAAVQGAMHAFARQTPQQQAQLRAQFDALEPIAQRGWLLGPAIGGDYPKLHALLAQMPEAQHAPMLRVLHRMTNAERADLVVLAQRVPPQDRAALVQALLSTADAQRSAWLQVRLAQ